MAYFPFANSLNGFRLFGCAAFYFHCRGIWKSGTTIWIHCNAVPVTEFMISKLPASKALLFPNNESSSIASSIHIHKSRAPSGHFPLRNECSSRFAHENAVPSIAYGWHLSRRPRRCLKLPAHTSWAPCKKSRCRNKYANAVSAP